MKTLDKIKAEIQKVLDAEGDSESAKAQALALFWVLELIDKYAEQEQTGKWKEIVTEHKCYARDDTYTTTEYHCSECGAEPFTNEDGFYEFGNYCHNCGCRMVEQRETETWHGIHAQITAPKGTFERIFNEADDDYDI